jgi:Tol biopolymer transport system component
MPPYRTSTALIIVALALSACGASSNPDSSASATVVASRSPTVPAGTLVYVRHPGGVRVLYTADAGGGDERELVRGPELARWSPDGTKLSVTAESPQGLVFVGLINPDGTHYVQFDSPDPALNLGCSAWSPDADRLACEGWDDKDPTRNGIFSVRASDGGDLTRVTSAPDGTHDAPGDYSPDGRQIAFVRINPSDEEHSTLLVVNVDGSGERQLTEQPIGLSCDWSPDGSSILADADGTLLLVPAEGGESSPIDLGVAGAHAARAAWSPDGQMIAFSLAIHTAGLDRWPDIYTANADGSEVTQVTDTPDEGEELEAWGP